MDKPFLTLYLWSMTESEQELLRTRLDQAWPNERLQALGELQVKLLNKFVGQEVTRHQGKAPPEKNLASLLYQIEEYYPEELILIKSPSGDESTIHKLENVTILGTNSPAKHNWNKWLSF